jgi:hypothetical protein
VIEPQYDVLSFAQIVRDVSLEQQPADSMIAEHTVMAFGEAHCASERFLGFR